MLAALSCQGRSVPAETASEQRPAQRIVSQLILGDEILWELGVQDRVVGVSKLTDDPHFSLYPQRWPAAVPRVPSHGEALVALQPDLVVLASFTSADLKRLLRGAGIRVVEIDRFNGFDDFRHNVRAIAEAVGAAEAGEELVRRFDQELARLSVPVSASSPTVVSWADGMVAASKTTFDDAARAAGLINVAARDGLTGHRRITLEQVVVWDPQLLVVPCSQSDCSQEVQAQLGVAQTRAARSGKVLSLPPPLLTTTGWGMLRLVGTLASANPRPLEEAP